MRLVHYYALAGAHASGVTAAIQMWAKESAALGLTVDVLHANSAKPGHVHHIGSSRSTYLPVSLRRHLRHCDVLVLHEGWTLSNLVAAATSRYCGVPYVVMPHGVYEPGVTEGLKNRRGIRSWLEARLLRQAAAVHVHHDSEIPLIHAISPGAAVIVHPTGMGRAAWQWYGGGGYAAWLGRLDLRHKGLDVLVEALKFQDPADRPFVVLHGQDYNGGLAELEGLLNQHRLRDCIDLRGPIWGPSKESFLSAADCYLHLAAWECMSIMLLEALAAGMPCVISDTMHISSTCARFGAAVVTGRNPNEVATAMERVTTEAADLHRNALRMMDEVYNWDRIIPAYILALKEISGRDVRTL